MASTLPRLPVFEAIAGHDPQSSAVIHSLSGRRFTYGGLLKDVADAKYKLREAAGDEAVEGQRIAFLVENGYDYVGSNGIAVPLSSGFPASELRYILENSEALMLLSSTKFQSKAEEVVKEGLEKPLKLQIVEKRLASRNATERVQLDDPKDEEGGMMLYTSGTTSRPKGVLLPTSVLTAQSRSLLKAWNYTPADHLLHVLPLHHIHGTVNALLTPLFAGSCIEFLFPFNVSAVWDLTNHLPDRRSNNLQPPPILALRAQIPTFEASKEALSPSNLRLNISGSAALPTPTKAAWTELSNGNVLLERYGMTEVGMALSCGLDFADRVDGSVGWPLPFVEARLVDTETGAIIPAGEEKDAEGKEREGEIQLRGPTVFKEYWRNAKATAEEFVEGEDGNGRWFKTGDVATRREVEGAGKSGEEWARGPMYFIRGRKSVDIIKSGGEKVSALEIERELLSLPQIAEAAVIKQRVGGGKTWGVMDMRRSLKDKLASYKIPQELKVVEALPKNAMGKINKKSLVKEIFGDGA
ncbi:hypothetical protein G7Y79_00018g045820 [Physcia stellaris]|nr:hypothetical protein G7Y79_00018g045820 [Physcia stellaris]